MFHASTSRSTTVSLNQEICLRSNHVYINAQCNFCLELNFIISLFCTFSFFFALNGTHCATLLTF